jgi:hypothetical protein
MVPTQHWHRAARGAARTADDTPPARRRDAAAATARRARARAGETRSCAANPAEDSAVGACVAMDAASGVDPAGLARPGGVEAAAATKSHRTAARAGVRSATRRRARCGPAGAGDASHRCQDAVGPSSQQSLTACGRPSLRGRRADPPPRTASGRTRRTPLRARARHPAGCRSPRTRRRGRAGCARHL